MFRGEGRLKLGQFVAGAADCIKKGDPEVSQITASIRIFAAYFSTIIRERISRCRAWQKLVQ